MTSKGRTNTQQGIGSTTGEYQEYTSPNISQKTHTRPKIYYKQVTDTNEFINKIQENKNNTDPEIAWHVDTPSPDDLKGKTLYETSNGSTFAVDPETHYLSALSAGRNQNGESLDNMRALVELSVQKGGTNFDSFEKNYEFYLHTGFVPTRWTNWDSTYRPEMEAQGWKGEYGTERIIEFEYNPQKAKQMQKDEITVNEWATGENYFRY